MYCLPAVIYIGLSVIGILYTLLLGEYTIGFAFVQLIFVWLFSWFLDFLCSRGYTIASWLLVFFPFIFMFALVFGVLMLQKENGGQPVTVNDISTAVPTPAPAPAK